LRGLEEEKVVAVAVEGQEAEHIEAAPGVKVAEDTGVGGIEAVELVSVAAAVADFAA
jgi:hypothetical protein